MLQCAAEMCSKRSHVRLLYLLGTSCEVSPSAATGGPQSAQAHFGAGKTSVLLPLVVFPTIYTFVICLFWLFWCHCSSQKEVLIHELGFQVLSLDGWHFLHVSTASLMSRMYFCCKVFPVLCGRERAHHRIPSVAARGGDPQEDHRRQWRHRRSCTHSQPKYTAAPARRLAHCWLYLLVMYLTWMSTQR